MPRLFAFLRAINVGGHTVKMDDLRQLFESLGLSNVETFIASGNVIFETEKQDVRALENEIETRLREALGYEVTTFIRTGAELAEIARYQPFRQFDLEAATTLNIAFLAEPLDDQSEQKLMALKTEIDDFHAHGREIYWSCRKKQSESTFSNAVLEKTLRARSTLRGLGTIQKMAAKYATEEGEAQARRLENVGIELAALLRQSDVAGRIQNRPGDEDAGNDEWSVTQILGHMAEMIPYWLEHCRRLIAATGEPPHFGRTLEAPERLAGVEMGGTGNLDELQGRVESEIQTAAQAIRQMTPTERAKPGIHLRHGEMTVAQVVERFIVAHAEEHLEQVWATLQIKP